MVGSDNGGVNSYFSSIPLYVEDSYIREFDANVTKSGPKFVVLNQTAFYPESGGQPTDTGILSYENDVVVVHKVMKRGREIFHYLRKNIPLGTTIHGVIDWEPRYFNMRRHSAEHLLTGLFEKEGAGPKVYSDLMRLDFRPSELTEEIVHKIETEFNRIIESDISLQIYYASRNELEGEKDERKKNFLKNIPKIFDKIRMVEIPEYALTFCFGTHVHSTSEIGRLASLELSEGKKKRKTVSFLLE